ncbi:ATP-dependent DNA ligase [Jongsikchunia kroppenstedtii]|uniref:ATP-dependent DNA ligase n=1 Tax=Jongsikchunia kroppenstedtii TaxID=1121721 RepID=UPI000381DB6E|nr:ATP-dependent DNA ligase [Jongsikchunia kroppenstedtii]
MSAGGTIDVNGHEISVTHLDKVIYPQTGTRKVEIIDYYNRIADVMIPHITRRPVTRKRWPDGVDATPFFEKNLPDHAPAWIERQSIEHSDRDVKYPIIDTRAALVWFGQQSALELHVPQYRFDDALGDGIAREELRATRKADRIVFDLDPGPGIELARCAEVALAIREILAGVGMTAYPVTSGSKGIHVYARLPAPVSPDGARKVAKQIATQLQHEMPDRVTASMAKSQRVGRVFIDWSQNSGSKTTLAPYSLRGTPQPCAAAPREWDELTEKDIRQLLFTEVLERAEEYGDLIADLDPPSGHSGSPTGHSRPSSGRTGPVDQHDGPLGGHERPVGGHERPVGGHERPVGEHERPVGGGPVVDLGEYRRKRDETKTPEPFGDEQHQSEIRSSEPIFVIQEHHATRLHYDFRLERDGVLVSWAVPKNLPVDSDQNRLAIQTEDHPMDYATFEGKIPKGEYGGGTVSIWDHGTYETEKWRDKEIIVRLHGERIQGRYVLIKTGDKNWLAHLMSDVPRPILPDSLRDPRPMLASDESIENLTDDRWAFEGKWDGYRVLVRYQGGKLRLTSRSGQDLTADFPELHEVADDLGLIDVILDGEIVAVDRHGRTNFTLLASRSKRSNAESEDDVTIKLMLFDALYLNGTSLLRRPWSDRRALLDELAPVFARSSVVEIPPLLDGPGSAAMAHSREKGWEGVVAKRRDSTYQQGRRTTTWLKQKNWRDIEVVIGGWRPGKGNRDRRIGSLLVGLPEETGLRYVGRVGSGLSDRELDDLRAELEPLQIKRSPFIEKLDRPVQFDAVWVLPKLVVEVRFMDWTSTGHLRHPTWRGIRRDKLPGDL